MGKTHKELGQGDGDGDRSSSKKRISAPLVDPDDGHKYGVNPSYDNSARNPNMDAVLKSMTNPVLVCSTPWHLNGLCKASGFTYMCKLPR